MNGETHSEITKEVVQVVAGSYGAAVGASEFAAFPDEVDDIDVRGVGTHIVGRALCSLTHFQVPTTLRSFRGYCWSSDTSIQPRFATVPLPHREVLCDTSRWTTVVGARDLERHPLYRLLRDLNGQATVAADQLTYPTAAVMAEWIGGCKKSTAQLGCILHFVQDAAVQHHASGWLLHGHASYEGALQEAWHTTSDSNKGRWLEAAARGRQQMTPRRAVEELARLQRRGLVSEPLVFARAIQYSAAVVRWWMGVK